MRALRRGFIMAAIGLLAALFTPTPAHAATFNVKTYGATGNGSTNDTAAINAAINDVFNKGGIIEFPAGTYKSANSIHLKSNITFQLDSGATIMGAPNDTYDAAESNPFDS